MIIIDSSYLSNYIEDRYIEFEDFKATFISSVPWNKVQILKDKGIFNLILINSWEYFICEYKGDFRGYFLMIKKNNKNLKILLCMAFNWETTREGYMYWRKQYNNLSI